MIDQTNLPLMGLSRVAHIDIENIETEIENALDNENYNEDDSDKSFFVLTIKNVWIMIIGMIFFIGCCYNVTKSGSDDSRKLSCNCIDSDVCFSGRCYSFCNGSDTETCACGSTKITSTLCYSHNDGNKKKGTCKKNGLAIYCSID